MSPRIDFDYDFQYRSLPPFGYLPILDVTLVGPAGEDGLLAIIDTGAKYCLFNGLRAKAVGLELGNGRLEIFGTRFQCEVAFSEQEIRRELLGRHTLFTQTRFGFREGMILGYFHPQK